MFNVKKDNITLASKAKDKKEVLTIVAKKFQEKHYLYNNFLVDSKKIELEISTYLGNGIVLPNLPISARDKVINNGIEIF